MDSCVQSCSSPRAALPPGIRPARPSLLPGRASMRRDQFHACSLNEYGKDLASGKCCRPTSVRVTPRDHVSLIIEF